MNNITKHGLLLLALLTFTTPALALLNTTTVDGDTLPDTWEVFHSGGTGMTDTSDSDGDGYNDKDEYDRGTDPMVAETVRVEAQRRIPPMIESLSIPETMVAGTTYRLSWNVVGYEGAYTTHIAMFDCTGVAPGTCGDSYGASGFFSGVTVTSSMTTPAPWSYGTETASSYSYTSDFIVPATRADGSAWPDQAGGTPIVVRFYQRSNSPKDIGKASISLLMPGGVSQVYYDQTGRRVQKVFCPAGAVVCP